LVLGEKAQSDSHIRRTAL